MVEWAKAIAPVACCGTDFFKTYVGSQLIYY